jgi:hypothetical protein
MLCVSSWRFTRGQQFKNPVMDVRKDTFDAEPKGKILTLGG